MQQKPPLLASLAQLARGAVPLARACGMRADTLEAAAATLERVDRTIGPVAFAVRDALNQTAAGLTDEDEETDSCDE